jgi:hypothetical protein
MSRIDVPPYHRRRPSPMQSHPVLRSWWTRRRPHTVQTKASPHYWPQSPKFYPLSPALPPEDDASSSLLDAIPLNPSSDSSDGDVCTNDSSPSEMPWCLVPTFNDFLFVVPALDLVLSASLAHPWLRAYSISKLDGFLWNSSSCSQQTQNSQTSGTADISTNNYCSGIEVLLTLHVRFMQGFP